jgi:hypothetical protein
MMLYTLNYINVKFVRRVPNITIIFKYLSDISDKNIPQLCKAFETMLLICKSRDYCQYEYPGP